MIKDVYLLEEKITQDELLNEVVTYAERCLTVEIFSVYGNEFYKARQSKINAQLLIKINPNDYDYEKIVRINNKMYDIYRTFLNEKDDCIELYLEERIDTDVRN